MFIFQRGHSKCGHKRICFVPVRLHMVMNCFWLQWTFLNFMSDFSYNLCPIIVGFHYMLLLITSDLWFILYLILIDYHFICLITVGFYNILFLITVYFHWILWLITVEFQYMLCLVTWTFFYILLLITVGFSYSLILITMGFYNYLCLNAMKFYHILCLITVGFITFCYDYGAFLLYSVIITVEHYLTYCFSFIGSLLHIDYSGPSLYFVIITVRHHHRLVWLQMTIISYCFKLQCTIFAFKCFWLWGTLIIFCLDYSGPEHHWWQLPCVGTGSHYWSSSQSPCLLHL